MTQDWPVVIVGIGNLGHALANYSGFRSRGFRVVALLDADPIREGEVGRRRRGPPVRRPRADRQRARRRDRRHRHARAGRAGRRRPDGRLRDHQHPQLRAERDRGARRRRRTQGRPVDRAADPRLPRAAQGPGPGRCRHERPRRGHLPQLRAGRPARAARPRRRRRPQADQRRRRQRARHRGDRDRHLQPGRDLRRGRPLPRQRRGRSRGCSSSAPARPPRRCCRTSTSTTTTARSPTCSRSPPGSTRWPSARARSSARPARRCGCGQELGTVGPALNVLFQQALRVGKRSRAETGIDQAAPSLVSAALDRSDEAVGAVAGKRVVVVGAGAMAGLATATVARLGAAEIARRQPHRRPAPTASPRSTAPARSPLDRPAPPSWRRRLLITCTGATGILSAATMLRRAPAPATGRSPSSTWRCRTTSTPSVGDAARRHPDRPRPARRRAARHRGRPRGRRGAPDRRRGGHRVPRRPPPGQRHPDRGRAALDGHRRRRRRDGPARRPAARPRRRRPAPRSGTPYAGSPTSCSTSRRSGSRSSPTRHGAVSYAAALAELFALDPEAVDAVTRPEGLHRATTRPASAPAPPCSPPPRPSSVADARPRPARPRGRAGRGHHRGRPSQAAGTPLAGIRRHRRLRQRPARRAARRRDRRRRALAQGPADRTPPTASRSPPCPTREDPRDVVVARDGLTLGELPAGSRVGTGSPRRAAQLHALGLGLDVVGDPWQRRHQDRQGPVGGVRRSRARAGRAGPDRPARRGHRGARPAADAPGSRAGCAGGRVPRRRRRWRPTWRALDDPRTRAAVDAERAVLATLEGGCSAPIGALAEVAEGDDGDELWLRAVALSPDGALVGADVRIRRPDRRGRRRHPAWRRRCSPTGQDSSTDADQAQPAKKCRTHDARQDQPTGIRHRLAPRRGCRSWAAAPATPTC